MKKIQFELWLLAFNKNYDKNIIYIQNNLDVTLNNAWLSGFSDAEGCFGAYNRPSNKYIKIRYVVSQKWEEKLMSKIAKLFDGNIYFLKSYEGYNMVVSSLSKLKKVINYFEKYF